MITLLPTSDLSLPYSVRSYIDCCSYEYTKRDAWSKIADIAYRLKRGADLLPDFIEDINRHIENPAYSDYEHTAKESIAYYIELLRTNNEDTISYEILHDKMSFAALFQLFTEEILYRYWEHETSGGKVECYFDEVHYDYNEIASRYTGANATRDFVKYISTSKETLRNIEVSESSIKLKNGWSLLADRMYGCPIWSDKEEDELIYPGDATFIHTFNKKAGPDYRFVVGVPPMPFSGNLLRAKIVILTLNPGYVENVNKNKCMDMSDTEKGQLLCLMKSALSLRGEGIYNEHVCSREQGDFYWQKAFSKLAIDAYGRPSEDNNHPIYEDIAFLQMIGYHSKKFKSSVGLKHLPSTIFTNLLIKYLAVETDKTFLVLRSETLWKEILGEKLWMKLESEGRIITKGHKGMSQAITRGNIKKDNGYDKLVEILKR